MPLSEVRRYIRVPEIEYFDTLKNRLCLFCEGNLKINGGLILDWGRSKNDFFDRRIVKTSKGDFSRASTTNTVTWTGNLLVGEHACALFVTGNLTVSRGILNTNINGGPALQVKGLTRAGDLLAGSANIFLGEVKLYGGLYAYYNRGEVYIESLKADFICSWDNAFLNIRKLDVDACQVCMDHEHLGIMKRKPARK